MKTEKLYQQNVYLKQNEAALIELSEENGFIAAVFDSTIFFPTGGGQLCDGGSIAGHRVLDVKEDKERDLIIHYLSPEDDSFCGCGTGAQPKNCADALRENRAASVSADDHVLKVGSRYTQLLDWEKRFSHMQMHCGEHLISGAFLKLFGANNKGFHMGEDYVTIDIDWDGKELSPEMIRQAEQLANKWVCDNIPVETRWFATAEEAMSLPCRKAIKFGENISVVLIGDEKDPADCCACCGTHPSSTGQIGLIKITHHEKYKSMNRFYVKVGAKALSDYDNKQDILTGLANKYSCDANDLEKTLDAAKQREEEIYKKYNSLKGFYQNIEIENLRSALKEPKEKSIRIYRYEQFDLNDLQNMVRKLTKEISDVTVFVSQKENSCVIASDGKTDCGKLVKENAPIYSGKGGGKPDLARALFDTGEKLELYLDLIEKHLR